MNTEALKISLVQRILSIGDVSILEKVNLLLNKRNIVGYNPNGVPISELEYIADINLINKDIDIGTAELFTSIQVRKNIIDENNLASKGK